MHPPSLKTNCSYNGCLKIDLSQKVFKWCFLMVHVEGFWNIQMDIVFIISKMLKRHSSNEAIVPHRSRCWMFWNQSKSCQTLITTCMENNTPAFKLIRNNIKWNFKTSRLGNAYVKTSQSEKSQETPKEDGSTSSFLLGSTQYYIRINTK